MENKIEILNAEQENTGWQRYIYFKYNGKEYGTVLFWNEHEGYELMFQTEDEKTFTHFEMPEWAKDWDEDNHDGMTLEHYLDDLTWKQLEGVK